MSSDISGAVKLAEDLEKELKDIVDRASTREHVSAYNSCLSNFFWNILQLPNLVEKSKRNATIQ